MTQNTKEMDSGENYLVIEVPALCEGDNLEVEEFLLSSSDSRPLSSDFEERLSRL